MNPDELCTSDQWSVLSSAASHSQFAGVLGGFLITAIALLMDKKRRESIHTLALFSSAVLILMLSSFLFSLITGNQVPAVGADPPDPAPPADLPAPAHSDDRRATYGAPAIYRRAAR